MSNSLYLPNINCKLKPIEALTKSLSNSFKVTLSKDLEKAVELANYYITIKEYHEAIKLLESFVYDVSYTNNGHAWSVKCDGLAFLAYVFNITNDYEKQNKAIEIISSNNIDKNDLDWLIEQAEEDVKFYLEDNDDEFGIYDTLTKKEKLLTHHTQIMELMYYSEVLSCYKADVTGKLILKISEILQKEYELLRLVLTGK